MFTQTTKILIVDDVQSLRDLLKAYLRRLGFQNIFEADDGQNALDALWNAQNAKAPFELVISDWNMPNMDGLNLLKRVRQVPDWKNLPFILLTTESEKEKVIEAVKADVSNYMIKPVEEVTLKEKLAKAWEWKNSR